MPAATPRNPRTPRALSGAPARWTPTRPEAVMRHAGTNGWLSSWGTNAHGEIAGCPPGGRRR